MSLLGGSTALPSATSPCPATTIDTVADPSFDYNNGTPWCSMLDQTDDKVDRVEDFFEESPKIQISAANWNACHRSSGTERNSKCKLNNHFVQLTRFDSDDSGQEENKRKQDLKMATARTINDIFPLWQNNSTHRDTCNLILKESTRLVSA